MEKKDWIKPEISKISISETQNVKTINADGPGLQAYS